MILKLDHFNNAVAEEIRDLFQVSYAVEAKLLKAVDFPPLKRPLCAFKESNTDFYGYEKDGVVAGVIEVNPFGEAVHIQSLVVRPEFFRQGVGSALVRHVLGTYSSPAFTVETGMKNAPAIALYKAFDFIEVRQWDTDHGVRKVRFMRKQSAVNS